MMLSPHRVLPSFVVLALAGLAAGCGGSDDAGGGAVPSGTSAAVAAPDRTSWEATFKKDATVLDAAMVASALKNPTTDDGVYRFDASAGDAVAKLPVGRAVLIPGVDVVKVKAVSAAAGEIVVATERASLPDVVEDGKATWDIGMDFGATAAAPAPGAASPAAQGLRQKAAPAPVSRLGYNGPVGMFDVRGDFTPGPDSLRFVGLVSFKSGSSILKVALDGTLKRFRNTGEVTIRGGLVEAFYFEASDLDIVLDMNLGGVALGKGNESLSIPIDLTIPAMIGPVPVYFSIGAKLEVNPSLGQTSSSRGKAHFVIKGSAGMAWSKADGFRRIGSLEGSDVKLTDYEGVSTLDCGLGILAQFPVLKMGVGVSQGGAGGFLAEKAEVVTNMSVRYEAAGPYPVITGNCFEANLNFGTYAGGEFRMAGLSFSKEVPVWVKTHALVKEGKACK